MKISELIRGPDTNSYFLLVRQGSQFLSVAVKKNGEMKKIELVLNAVWRSTTLVLETCLSTVILQTSALGQSNGLVLPSAEHIPLAPAETFHVGLSYPEPRVIDDIVTRDDMAVCADDITFNCSDFIWVRGDRNVVSDVSWIRPIHSYSTGGCLHYSTKEFQLDYFYQLSLRWERGHSEHYRVLCAVPPEQAIQRIISGNIAPVPVVQVLAQANEQNEEVVASEDYPCDDEELQVNYDSSLPNYHYYDDIENEVCSVSSAGCTVDFVFETMISQVRFIAPTTDVRTPVSNCQINVLNLPGPWGVDSIRTTINSTNRSVTNYTKPDHVLHPGRATRTVVQRGSSIYVVTVGEGNGSFPGANEFFASGTWLTEGFNNVDRLLIREVNRILPEPENPSNQQF